MYTYKAAGAQVGVEKSVLSEVCRIIGWDENADGTFASGGSMTNLMSMIMARDAISETVKNTGVRSEMMVYTSADSHYSIPKNASFCGIGRNQVRYIKTNKKGQINVLDLARQVEEDIQQGFTPTLVNLTAGTTVLGAFDDVRAVQNICSKYNIWLHLDGAYCGSVLFSRKYRHLIDGVELVDSFSFNAHKMIGTPLTCSLIVVKNKKHLFNSFSNEANYLYQAEDDHFNLGKTSLQCGRRNDALKFWTLWKSVGTVGLEKIIDKQFELADYARAYIENNENYTLHSYEESISVCFNYKGVSAKKICTALYENSEILVGFGDVKNQNFVRLVTINAQNSKEDILSFFKTMEVFVDKNMVVQKQAQLI
jgi:sulfinoalanine decarboxylase/sulfinoalanine decarboxylase/aspartate 1-decarboxylase